MQLLSLHIHSDTSTVMCKKKCSDIIASNTLEYDIYLRNNYRNKLLKNFLLFNEEKKKARVYPFFVYQFNICMNILEHSSHNTVDLMMTKRMMCS